MKDHYVQAVLESLAEKDSAKDFDAVLKDLKRVLAAHGHANLLTAILRGVARALPTESNHRPVVTLATDSKAHLKQHAVAIKALEIEGSDDPIIKKDSTVIGGFKIKAADTVVDATYKTKLVNLYRQLAK